MVALWVGSSGYLDDVPLDDVGRFEQDFLDDVQRNHSGIYDAIRETRDLADDTAAALKEAVEEFRGTFEVTGGGLLVSEDEAEPTPEGQVGQDKLIKRVEPAPESGEQG